MIFKNMEIICQSELRFIGKSKVGHPCSIIKSIAMQSSLYNENVKRNNDPVYDKKCVIFRF
jgi:hypothetical protein